MTSLLVLIAAVASADVNLLTNPGFESSTTGWSNFWARATDSGSASVSSSVVHSGNASLEVLHTGSEDWSESSKSQTPVTAGELWSWSAWVRVESLSGSILLNLVSRDGAGNVVSWSTGETSVPADTGWQRIETRVGVPRGTATLQPRLIGYGPAHAWFDDADFHREEAPPEITGPATLRNDSLRVVLDLLDLSLDIVDSIGGDSLRTAGIPSMRFDSLHASPDSLCAWIRSVAGGWPARFEVALHGGGVAVRLVADSATPLDAELDFPGSILSRAGQSLAMPRGTGLAIPATYTGTDWSLRSAQYWEWQVSTSLAGATDGRTGYVISVDQPWDARLYLDDNPGPMLRARVIQVPSKHVLGHARSALIAPLRGGGWSEMALRHRQRMASLGRIRDWSAKIAANPRVESLRGASDFWIEGSGWATTQWTFFDSLRRFGADRAVIHWRPQSRQIDSLNSHGWLTSVYECYADAYPPGTNGYSSLEYPDGAILEEDGLPLKGWLAHLDNGTDLQALEVCSARHPSMARSVVATDQAKNRRNARFIDVELAVALQECWSATHPVDRARDASNRVATLATVKDTFGLVTGSEQARDFATGHVDWGEGPMSIVTVEDAGYDWKSPEAPESRMDTLSMSPSWRIPLLPLALHDAFAPTWYTGDGQSKVPARWDAKDAWNALYATMPLIMPDGRRMWNSLAGRYLRSMVPLGAIHRRVGFEAMTGFDILSQDRAVQRTRFANGWSVVANFSERAWDEGGRSLPPQGYIASGNGELVERALIDGATRTRMRLSDRWYLDPEGSTAHLDGVRTAGAVHLVRESDSTLLLAFVGNQTAVDLDPRTLPWPANALQAEMVSSGAAVALQPIDSGMLRLARTDGQAFYRLKGHLGSFVDGIRRNAPRTRLETHRRGSSVSCQWFQQDAGPIRLESFTAGGRALAIRSIEGRSGWNRIDLPAGASPAWLRLSSRSGSVVAAVPRTP